MAEGSLVLQSTFVGDGNNIMIEIPSDVDKLVVENLTQWGDTNNGYGFRYTWYKDMGSQVLMEYHPAADHTCAVNDVNDAIFEYDASTYTGGGWKRVTAGTNATQPVYDTPDTTGLSAGAIVRLKGTDHDNLNGMDFTVANVVANTSFRLDNELADAPGRVAGGDGYYKIVAPHSEAYKMFTPALRYLSNVTSTDPCVVTTLADHNYSVGQRVKFHIPEKYKMTELDGIEATITSKTASTFTLDIDTDGYTAFEFPEFDETPFEHAYVVPAGDGMLSNTYLNPTATHNQGFRGLILVAGTTRPGGNNGDTIKWTAYKTP